VVECILKAGEMIFVPSTWWHTVLNLEESIAITQNFCNSHNISKVLKFFEMKGKQKLSEELLDKIQQKYPDLYEKLRSKPELTFWQKVEHETVPNFCFNFGEMNSDE